MHNLLLAFLITANSHAKPSTQSLKVGSRGVEVSSESVLENDECYLISASGFVTYRRDHFEPRTASARYRSDEFGNRIIEAESIIFTSGVKDMVLISEKRVKDTFFWKLKGDGNFLGVKVNPLLASGVWFRGAWVPMESSLLVVVSHCPPIVELTQTPQWNPIANVFATVQSHYARGDYWIPWAILAGVLTIVPLGLWSQTDTRDSEPKPFQEIHLKPPLDSSLERALENDEWWLFIPGAWLIALLLSLLGILATVCAGILEWGDFTFTMLTLFGARIPTGVSATLVGALLLGTYVILPVRWALHLAQSRSSRVRGDPRKPYILQFSRVVSWWNSNLPRINDYVMALDYNLRDSDDTVRVFREAHKAIEAKNYTLARRLTVVPLGEINAMSQPPDATLQGIQKLLLKCRAQATVRGWVVDTQLEKKTPEPNPKPLWRWPLDQLSRWLSW